ncbi:MAG TPA: GDSL-type esterase/lipase family protein, partial [Candidatus Bathyarchaeia archaeon]|nr:GDSL-type esterase/lipase family protein [Candidatus Bathyarchaeia archaeon]
SIVDDVRRGRAAGPDGFVFDAEAGWRARPGYAGELYGATRVFDAQGFLTVDGDDLAARAGKIVLLGDSRTFGNGVAAEATFAEQLEEAIPGASTVNLGLPGYTSYQGLRTLETRGLPLDPAVVVLAFDFNDRRYVLRASDVDGPEHFRDLAARAERRRWARLADRSTLVRLTRRLVSGPDPDAGSVDADDLRPRVGVASYRANLERMLELCRARRIRAVVMTFGDHPDARAPLDEGRRALARGDVPAALAPLRRAVGLVNPLSEAARRLLRETYAASGEASLASALSRVEVPFRSLHGGDPIEPDATYREAAEDVAKRAGVTVLDVGALLAAHPETYADVCHFDEQGHRLIADALASILAP